MIYNAQKAYDKKMEDKGCPAYALLIFSNKTEQ